MSSESDESLSFEDPSPDLLRAVTALFEELGLETESPKREEKDL